MFDFNVHLPCRLDLNTEGRILDDRGMGVDDLRRCHAMHHDVLKKELAGANFMLFNEELPYDNSPIGDWIQEVRRTWGVAAFTQLLDFRRKGIETALDRIAAAGINGVKFHSYVQRIGESDFQNVLVAARLAEERGFFICIDASYGTTWMYEYDNLRLAAQIIREIKSVPIIILHSGGSRYWDARLLADDGANVFLETSFTLPYYYGSSVEGDLAFIYRKIGIDRVLYASDFPYIPLGEAVGCIEQFLEKYKFSTSEREAICGGNARRLLSKLNVPGA